MMKDLVSLEVHEGEKTTVHLSTSLVGASKRGPNQLELRKRKRRKTV